jgi:hypothetical protein
VSDVFQEVEEEYRREQMAKFWQKYRMAVVGGVAVLIVGVAGFQGWTYWRARQIETSSRDIDAAGQMMALQGQEKEAADALAKVATNGSGGYPLIAQLQEAALRAETGDVKAAIALYDSAGAHGGLFGDYAQLRAAILLVERAPYDEIKKRLDPLAAGDGHWRLQAKELLAYASWRAGKKDEALKLYADVQAAPDVTTGTKRRALEMSALIGAGMKLADVRAARGDPLKPFGGGEPLLLQPKTPAPSTTPTPEGPNSLLGPDPAPSPSP